VLWCETISLIWVSFQKRRLILGIDFWLFLMDFSVFLMGNFDVLMGKRISSEKACTFAMKLTSMLQVL
jgi:hypothetical protein